MRFRIAFDNNVDSYLPFAEFEYPLKAATVKAIFAALKNDIVSYLRDIEEERPVLNEVRRELEALSTVTASKSV